MLVGIYTPEQRIHIADLRIDGGSYSLCFKKPKQDVYETLTLDQLMRLIVTSAPDREADGG